MNKNPYPVGPGWWHLLDLEIPQLYEIDPDLTDLTIEEDDGHCDVYCAPSAKGESRADMLGDVGLAIASQSAIICENCGEYTGLKPTQKTPYCSRCYHASEEERSSIREWAEEKYWQDRRSRGLKNLLKAPYFEVHVVYEPNGEPVFGDCFCAAVDLFKPGMTFRVYFKEDENGETIIKDVQRWYFG